MTRTHAALACSIVLAIAEPITWLTMVFSTNDAGFMFVGFRSLRYFTVLSNLLLGLASLVYAVYLARMLRTGKDVPHAAHVLKFAGTTATTLTLIVVLGFLGPLMGYVAMFTGVSFWLHLVWPVLGIVEFSLLDPAIAMRKRETVFALLPTLLYGIFYIANILVNGLGEGFATNDWYGFAFGGMQTIPIMYAAILLATWLASLALRAANNRRKA